MPITSAMAGVPASNFQGSSFQLVPVEPHGADHLAAGEERGHRLEQLAAAPQGAGAGRAAQLVAGEREEVGAQRLHVDRAVRHGLRAVHQR